MTKSELYYLAGKCLVMDVNPEYKNRFIELCKNDLIDWLQFITICSDNLVLPSIYLKFHSQGILEYLPAEIKEHLVDIYEMNKIRNREILKQIKSINAILKERKIIPLYFKGAGNLLDGLYSDIGERLMGDIDFMVPDKDFLTSVEIMLDAGYQSLMNSTAMNIRIWKQYPKIYHPDFIAVTEIHRKPSDHKRNDWFSPYSIFEESKILNMDDDKIYLQSDKHKIIHNFIHDQLDHKGNLYGIVPLRDIYDIYLLSKRISLTEVISQIRPQKKAIAYFAFARNVFGCDKQFFEMQNLSFWILKKKHDLNQNSRWLYKIYEGLVSGVSDIPVRYRRSYIRKFFQAFYSKEMRKKIFKKLKNLISPR